jgi:hypothetical protein
MNTVRRIATVLGFTAAITSTLFIEQAVFAVPAHADSVSVSVQVAEVVSVNQDGTTYSNASARPLIVSFPATFDGVEYQIWMVS